MNRRQKIVQEKFLNNEEAVIKRLNSVYEQSLKDITGKISDLDKSIGALQKALADVDDDEIGDLAKAFLGRRANITPAEAKETLQSMIQSKVYQKRYQEALKGQIDVIMDKMQDKEYKIVSDYLKECYEDGFIGTMFDLQGQGIPLCFPLDQEAMVRAVQLDSKISHGLYTRLGEDVALLKKKITAQVSRGIATGMSYQQVARGLANYTNIGYNNAIRIARTEGHRVQVQGTMDACYKAKEKGADVVKQWDSTLDGRTRESHSQVDGEIRELDKRFSNGLMFPGDPSGRAEEVINCRCALLQRARWALGDDFTKMDNDSGELVSIKADDYDEFKKRYWAEVEKQDWQDFDITEGGKYTRLTISDKNKYLNYIEHEFTTQKLTVKEVHQMWDKTDGYIQNSKGYQDINGFMRGLKPKLDVPSRRVTINVMNRVTKNNALTKDYIGMRKVDSGYLENVLGLDVGGLLKSSLQKNAFGRKILVQIPKDKNAAQIIADKINGLIGTDKGTITDSAFTSVSLSDGLNYFTHFPFKFEIQMPVGTNGLITDNLPESEFITKPNSALEIIGAMVYNDSEKDCVKIFARLVQ